MYGSINKPTFQSTPPVREETAFRVRKSFTTEFQSTPPVREETAGRRERRVWICIFQSTPPVREETRPASDHSVRMINFNPLLPCGRRRPRPRRTGRRSNFNPLLPCGRRLVCRQLVQLLRRISIHSSRAGGDGRQGDLRPDQRKISIHSSRAGGDKSNTARCPHQRISIHSSRAGGDATASRGASSATNFNPLLPCGRRPPKTRTSPRASAYFNPLLPCGRRLHAPAVRADFLHFNPLLPCGRRHLRA